MTSLDYKMIMEENRLVLFTFNVQTSCTFTQSKLDSKPLVTLLFEDEPKANYLANAPFV